MADELHVVLGHGPVGRAVAQRLTEQGRRVRIATRSGRVTEAPPGVDVMATDVVDGEAVGAACTGAAIVYGCVGLDYRVGWPERWPPMMAGMLAGASAAGARFVFMDNCYMYGPQDGPLHEDLPLTSYGRKPATRARLTRMWQDAHARGELEAVAVRAADFYGPGVATSAFGDSSFGRIAAGKPAQVVGDPDQPHSVAAVPDVARALISVGDDPDAYGQAWHVPNAPTTTVRELLAMFAAAVGQDLRVQVLPRWLMGVVGLVDTQVREMKEMLYQWDRPFVVDSAKFEQRFWSDPTPFDEGLAATAAAYRR